MLKYRSMPRLNKVQTRTQNDVGGATVSSNQKLLKHESRNYFDQKGSHQSYSSGREQRFGTSDMPNTRTKTSQASMSNFRDDSTDNRTISRAELSSLPSATRYGSPDAPMRYLLHHKTGYTKHISPNNSAARCATNIHKENLTNITKYHTNLLSGTRNKNLFKMRSYRSRNSCNILQEYKNGQVLRKMQECRSTVRCTSCTHNFAAGNSNGHVHISRAENCTSNVHVSLAENCASRVHISRAGNCNSSFKSSSETKKCTSSIQNHGDENDTESVHSFTAGKLTRGVQNSGSVECANSMPSYRSENYNSSVHGSRARICTNRVQSNGARNYTRNAHNSGDRNFTKSVHSSKTGSCPSTVHSSNTGRYPSTVHSTLRNSDTGSCPSTVHSSKAGCCSSDVHSSETGSCPIAVHRSGTESCLSTVYSSGTGSSPSTVHSSGTRLCPSVVQGSGVKYYTNGDKKCTNGVQSYNAPNCTSSVHSSSAGNYSKTMHITRTSKYNNMQQNNRVRNCTKRTHKHKVENSIGNLQNYNECNQRPIGLLPGENGASNIHRLRIHTSPNIACLRQADHLTTSVYKTTKDISKQDCIRPMLRSEPPAIESYISTKDTAQKIPNHSISQKTPTNIEEETLLLLRDMRIKETPTTKLNNEHNKNSHVLKDKMLNKSTGNKITKQNSASIVRTTHNEALKRRINNFNKESSRKHETNPHIIVSATRKQNNYVGQTNRSGHVKEASPDTILQANNSQRTSSSIVLPQISTDSPQDVSERQQTSPLSVSSSESLTTRESCSVVEVASEPVDNKVQKFILTVEDLDSDSLDSQNISQVSEIRGIDKRSSGFLSVPSSEAFFEGSPSVL